MYGGDDELYGGDDSDLIYGDYIYGGISGETIYGGDDELYAGDDLAFDQLFGEYIITQGGDDNVYGGNDELYGNDDGNLFSGDLIWNYGGNDVIHGGNDEIYSRGGLDTIFGDNIRGSNDGNDELYGGNDVIVGDQGLDNIRGDYIQGYGGNDVIHGGNDSINAGDGNDTVFGDDIDGMQGDNDTIFGGNDVIDARDGIQNNDNIDCDRLFGEIITFGIDVSADDPDNEQNCEYDNIISLASYNASNTSIQQGENVDLTLDLDPGIGPVKIIDAYVETPLSVRCDYIGALPIIVPIGGSYTLTFPDDFNTDPSCNTDTLGTYTATLITEAGDPITTEFNTSFLVLPESIIGAIGIIASIMAVAIAYSKKTK